jgi:prolycopene isomerase
VAEFVVHGDATFGLATETLDEHPSLDTRPAYAWRHCLIVPVGHPLADSGVAPSLSQLADEPLITYSREFAGRRGIDAAFAKVGLAPRVVLEAIDSDVIKAYVELGFGVGVIAEKLVAGLQRHGGVIRYRSRVTKVLLERGRVVGVRLANGQEIRAQKVVSNATRWDTFGGEGCSSTPLVAAEDTPAAEQTWRRRYKPSASFLSLHLGVRADVIPAGSHVHHLLLEDWAAMEAEQGTVFVSMPSLLDPSLAPAGHHIVHSFTPSAMDSWQGLSPQAYRSKKQADANRLIARLETLLPGLGAAITHQEVGTPRSHRRFLGRFAGSYGPIPALRLPGLLPMPFNRTGIEGLYCVGDSCFPGQGLNAVAFSGFACAHRLGADLGLNPWALPD